MTTTGIPTRRGGHPPRFRRELFKADLSLLAEALLCLSVVGPQPLAWIWLSGEIAPEASQAGWRLGVALPGLALGLVASLWLARRCEEVRVRARAAAGRPTDTDVLTILVTTLVSLVGAAAVIWFFFAGGLGPGY